MSELAIKIEDLGKRYRYGAVAKPGDNLRADITSWLKGLFHSGNHHASVQQPQGKSATGSSDYFWALKDINLEVTQGEVLGIIGRNGAGKSTLLKILSRITPPTTGSITYHGRVASLLEVGTGFHRELTGRENIFLNGSILGMARKEITRKFDEIVAFAEVDQFIDTPVKFYSSGMYVRLAFAVAAHLEPEILVVDEVLAVGDAAFQKKCLGKMNAVARAGRTVLFVSHNMRAVETLCSRAVLLDHGQMVANGKPGDVIDKYLGDLRGNIDDTEADLRFPSDPSKSGQITHLRVLNARGEPTLHHNMMEPIEIEMEFELRRDFPTLILAVHIWGSENTLILASFDSDWENFSNETKRDLSFYRTGCYRATLKLPVPLLNTGLYELETVLTPGPERADTRRGIYFEIEDGGSFLTYVTKTPRGGILATPVPWKVIELSAAESA